MRIPSTLATAVLVSFATSQLAAAEDVRVTCSATVAAVHGGGVGTGPFSSAQVGEAVTFVVDVEIALQLPFGDYVYAVNSPTSSLSIGSATGGFSTAQAPTVSFKDDNSIYGDLLGFGGQLGGGTGTSIQLFVSDVSGQSWSSGELETLNGTTVQTAGLVALFQIWSPDGSVNFDLQSIAFEAAPGGVIGTPYCAAEPNSTGLAGETSAYGLEAAAEGDLSLIATGLPTNVFGYFVASQTQGFTPNAGGAAGNLCLGGAIGRFVGPGQIKGSDFGGEIALAIDLTSMPTPTGPVSVNAGETWNFQLWHRDTSPAGATSNFTRGLALTFQ